MKTQFNQIFKRHSTLFVLFGGAILAVAIFCASALVRAHSGNPSVINACGNIANVACNKDEKLVSNVTAPLGEVFSLTSGG